MSSKWKLLKISEVADVIGGGTPSSDKKEYFGGDIPWITPKDLSNYKFRYISRGERSITKLGLQNSSARLVPKDTVLFTSRAPIGYVAIAQCDLTTNQGFKSLALKERQSPEFYYYLLKHNVPLIESRASGSTFKEISGQALKDTELLIPDYEKQLFIAEVLGKLDSKIELNNQINQTLEAMAQAIFKSWFVDFEPVKAKVAVLQAGGSQVEAELAAMTAISGKTAEQLSTMRTTQAQAYQQLAEIAALFPSAIQDSELGEIPEGWVETSVANLLDATIGGDWGKELPDDKHTVQVRVIRGTDIPNIRLSSDTSVPMRFINEKKLVSRQLIEGDLIIEVSGGSPTQPTGRSIFISNEILQRMVHPTIPASFCRQFRPKTKEIGLFLSLHMDKIYAEGKTWLYQNQSTGISNFQTSVFLEKEVLVIPDNKLLTNFSNAIFPYIRKIYSKQNILLTEIRDSLLPKLLSSEFDLPVIDEAAA